MDKKYFSYYTMLSKGIAPLCIESHVINKYINSMAPGPNDLRVFLYNLQATIPPPTSVLFLWQPCLYHSHSLS